MLDDEDEISNWRPSSSSSDGGWYGLDHESSNVDFFLVNCFARRFLSVSSASICSSTRLSKGNVENDVLTGNDLVESRRSRLPLSGSVSEMVRRKAEDG